MSRAFLALTAIYALATVSCGLQEALNRQVGESCTTVFECDDSKGLVCGGAGGGTCLVPGSPGTGELGDACDETSHCRIEYTCHAAGACAPRGVLPAGTGCDLVNYCAEGLACTFPRAGEIAGVCAAPDENALNGDRRCEKIEECTRGGTQTVGKSCLDTFDCALGLLCAADVGGKKCSQLPFYRGRSCPVSQADEGPLRALFEIHAGDGPPAEFYRQPFPADWRKDGDGNLELDGHPHPSFQLANVIADRPTDITKTYLKHISDNVKGFSTTAATYMRFSGRMDRDSFHADGDAQNIFFVDVGDGPFHGEAVPLQFDYRQSRGKYICSNRLAVRPADRFPLRPATTYAVYVTDGVRGKGGDTVGQGLDFRRMLGTEVGSGKVAEAHRAFGPLRAWLDEIGLEPSHVLTGTVFTTDDIHRWSRGMARVIAGQQTPEVIEGSVTLCTPGAVSPCESDGTDVTPDPLATPRTCPAVVSERFHEIHMQVSLPIFQFGVPPYLVSEAGGDIQLDGDGVPKVFRREPVCVALTIPKDAEGNVDKPAAGWPVVLYGHGTGGHYRTFTVESDGHGRATDVAKLPGDGRMAMVSWDQVQHGPRRGGSEVSPESLFFNFLNPKAARDNTLQGAGDVMALLKFLKETTFAVPGLGSVSFNGDKVMYFGHSQGTVTGPPGLVFSDVDVVVMSGAGGNLVQSLLNKTQPVNIADGIRFALADDGVDAFHPILNILQHFIAPSDTINYARNFFLEPPDGFQPKNVLHIYGKRDFFAPEANQRALAAAMGVTHLGPELTPIDGIVRDEGAGPLSDNIDLREGDKVTGVVVQYVPSRTEEAQADGTTRKLDDYDGHFVSFRPKDGAIETWQHYLESALQTGTPEVRR